MKVLLVQYALATTLALLLTACGAHPPEQETLRSVRTAEVRYSGAQEASRYFGSVQSRYEVAQAFRVGGKVAERRVDVGDKVGEGDVLAVLDNEDYRLTEQATLHQLEAARARALQAESDWRRLQALKLDGSVSDFDEEHAQSELRTSRAAAQAEARKLELARNQLDYTVLRASQAGVVTEVRLEVGQVVAAGQPVLSIADPDLPEIVVDVPEDQVGWFGSARFAGSLTSAPDASFDLALRELAPQAASQTRTYRAKLKPVEPHRLPLGASATLIVTHAGEKTGVAAIPASAITQASGQPAVWMVGQAAGQGAGVVELTRVEVHGYRNDQALVTGPPAGALVVTAGVQKMAPGLRVAVLAPDRRDDSGQASR